VKHKPQFLLNINLENIRPENGSEINVGEIFLGGVNKMNIITSKRTSAIVPSYASLVALMVSNRPTDICSLRALERCLVYNLNLLSTTLSRVKKLRP
jgi:hypothetical protein